MLLLLVELFCHFHSLFLLKNFPANGIGKVPSFIVFFEIACWASTLCNLGGTLQFGVNPV